MKLVNSHPETEESHEGNTRHEFVIGPLCETGLSGQKARLYHCRLCQWSFLVCGSRVAVVDERGEPIAAAESLSRFSTFEAGPCPVLASFAAVADPDLSLPLLRAKFRELGSRASRHFEARSNKGRPLLRVLGGLRLIPGKRS